LDEKIGFLTDLKFRENLSLAEYWNEISKENDRLFNENAKLRKALELIEEKGGAYDDKGNIVWDYDKIYEVVLKALETE
jgi:hypothetical protein